MDAQAFWNVIGNYNQQTIVFQIIIFIMVIIALVLSYTQKVKWAAKFILGIANLFIGSIFFSLYGTEPIQRFFAAPLYMVVGILFLYESWHSKDDPLKKPTWWQLILLFLYFFYPFISIILGNRFPQMVIYIMPCPIVSLSIAVYAGYRRKNKWLLMLLTIWGLTGIKSLFFNAYEDLILLICGVYCMGLLIKEIKHSNHSL